MKRLGCLLLAAAIVAALMYTGVITASDMALWGSEALGWTAGKLESLSAALRNHAVSGREDILLVNGDNPLPDGYQPGPLVRLYDRQRSFLLARDDLYLTETVFEAAEKMFAAAQADGLSGYILTSAYRTREDQQRIYAESEPGYAQLPGCSEHETGLAFDVTVQREGGSFEDTPHYRWLSDHCHEYGFIQRYPQGKEAITGVSYEPWHYRYVGTETAQKLHQKHLTLEEYMGR